MEREEERWNKREGISEGIKVETPSFNSCIRLS